MFYSWELGERYIRQLLGLSFFQDSESPLAAGLPLENATLGEAAAAMHCSMIVASHWSHPR